MNDGNIRVVKLACVSCAATLDITQGMERLACGFCGTSQTVERSGGTISLKGVEAVLQQVQIGTDKTAAELALARIKGDLNQANEKLTRYEAAFEALRAKIIDRHQIRISSTKATRGGWSVVAGILIASMGVTCFAAAVSFSDKGGAEEMTDVILSFIALAGTVAVSWWALRWQRVKGERFQQEMNDEVQRETIKANGEMAEWRRQIRALEAQAEEKKRIANS